MTYLPGLKTNGFSLCSVALLNSSASTITSMRSTRLRKRRRELAVIWLVVIGISLVWPSRFKVTSKSTQAGETHADFTSSARRDAKNPIFAAPTSAFKFSNNTTSSLSRLHIPAVIIPVLWEAEHVLNCIRSIDVPVRRLLLIVNTLNISNAFEVERVQLNHVRRTIQHIQEQFDTEHLSVHYAEKNMGFGPALNFGMQSILWADWWLCTSVDVLYPPRSLSSVVPFIQRQVVNGAMLFMLHDFAAVVFTRHMVARVGYFDEHIWPAYVEDCDLMLRVRKEAEKNNEISNYTREVVNVTGEYYALNPTPSLVHAGQRGSKQPGDYMFASRMARAHQNNVAYYLMKWGITNRHWSHGRGPFHHGCGVIMDGQYETPFNVDLETAHWELISVVDAHDAKQLAIFE